MCDCDKDGICYAGACYSSEKCNARDENGNPNYNDECPKCGKYLCVCKDS